MTIDTQTSQLLAHLRRGGNYSYFWAASQAKDSQGDALWKCTYWHNGSGPAELPADEHTQYGSVHLYFGVHPTKLLPKERLRDGKLKPIHPGNARAIIEEIAAVNCLFGDFDALGRLAKARCEGYSTWIAVGQALAELGDAGRALWIEWSKGSDKFDEEVCTAKWATFRADPKRLTLGSLFYWANEDDPQGSDDPRPAIDISTLDLPTVMPQAWDAMVASNNPPTLFRRAGELARLETTETDALMVKTVDPRRMAGILARAARWVRVSYDRKGNATEKETIPPAAVVDDAMVNVDPRIPALTRIVSAPTFADGETLLTTPGYHPAARIYYDPKAGVVVPDVPAEPTAADLERARALILDDLLVDFPFVSNADQAHAVALFLLPFVRELISGPTPLHLIEAPTMGSGKGLLADALLLPALGNTPTPMAEATTDEEWRKRITSALLGTPTVIYIDNLNRTLDAGALAAALTTTEYADRVLGKSEQVSLPVRCVWVATANNPTLSTEISRRCIRIRIDPRVDKPWQREQFKHPKLRTWIDANRGDLIWAALVICRYGLQHGATGRPLGSYEAWSDVLGRILAGAGFVGFLENLDALYDRADVEGAAWRALINAWWDKHQGTEQPASDLFPLVAEAEADVLINGKDETGRKRSFGKALARARDRVFSIDTDGGTMRLQVAAGGLLHKAQRWKLAPVEGGGFGYFGGFSASAVRENKFSSAALRENTQNTQYTHAALPAYALWHNGEYDEPVTVTAVLGEQDGVTYYAIEGSQTGIPADQVEFFEAEPAQEALL